MNIDWRMGIMPDIGGTFMQAFEQGREKRREADTRNALAAYATNPSEHTLNPLAQYVPEFVMQERGRMAEQQRAQQKQQLDQVGIIGRLLDGVNDEATYQQRLGLAKQYGIDTANAPQSFDPQWIANTRMMVQALQTEGPEKISGIARELVDAGYQPGTPEFSQAMTSVISNKYYSEYVNDRGELVRRSALDMVPPPRVAGQAQAEPAPAPVDPSRVINPEVWRGAINGLGRQPAIEWLKRNGMVIKMQNDSDYDAIPPGAEYIDPNGNRRWRHN